MTMMRRSWPSVLQLVQHRQPVGRLIVTFRQASGSRRSGPAVSHDQ
jgi:hypothetical protein